MGISHDIISEFVKITNDKKEKPKEETVYATIVQASDGKYVKLDGSDLITPTETTTDIEEGERVTVLIKDHSAIITGNISSPSASVNRVNGIVDVVSEKLGVFEHIVADKIDVNELNAYKATVEHLIAGKAEIGELKATKAEIEFLDADVAHIKTLVNGNLTSDNILSFNITADKVTMADAFIKDAMVASINAAKINSGRINTNNVVIGSDDGGMLISGATQQFTDKNGQVRIQIGRDSTGDFTFVLYGEDGTGQIINQNGITASAVSDGLIVNDMINDKAAISGGKLDISSVIFEINNENDTAIHSSKIYLDEQNQSLEAAFNSLKTQVDTIVDISIDGDLKAFTEQIQSNTAKIEMNKSSINTLVSEDAIIRKEVSDLEGNLVETTNTLSSKYSSLKQNMDGFKLEVVDVYAKKSTVKDLENNLATNYTTTEAMNSAITQNATQIATTVTRDEIRNSNIAGVNLFKGTKDYQPTEIWWCENVSITEELFKGSKVCRIEADWMGMEYNLKSLLNDKSLIVGETYTMSVWAKTNGENCYGGFYCHWENKQGLLITSEWQQFEWTFIFTQEAYDGVTNTNTIRFEPYGINDTHINVFVACWKLEKGKIATDYQPSSQDYLTATQMDSAITQKATEISLTVAKKEIQNIQVGGTNLLGSHIPIFGLYNITSFVRTNATSFEVIGHVNNDGAVRIADVIDGNGWYTISFDVKCQIDGWNVDVDFCDGEAKRFNNISTTDYTHCVYSYEVTNYTSDVYCFIDIFGLSYQTFWFKNIKVERGKIATDYSPCPSDYSTTTEMNSAITQKADEINLSVSQTINNIQTGGKNLIKNGNFEDGLKHWKYERFSGVTTTDLGIWEDGEWVMDGKKQCSFNTHGINDDSQRKGEWTIRQHFKTVVGQEYTISYMIAGHRSYKKVAVRQTGDWAYLGSKDYGDIFGGKNANDWVYDSITFTATTSETMIWFIMRETMSGTNAYMWFTDVCCIEGNKAQRFIPSFEEYSTTTQMNSAIQLKADSITSTVNSNYTTLNNKFNDYPTTTQMNSAIIQKANEITSNVNMTKIAGVELLSQGYRRNSTSGYYVRTGQGQLNVSKWGLYTSKPRTWVETDFIAIEPGLPLEYMFYMQNTQGHNPLTYVGFEQYTWTKAEIGENAATIYVVQEKFAGYKYFSGTIPENSFDGNTRYIKLRWLTNWDNSTMEHTYIHECSVKQLGCVNSSTRIAQMADKIETTVSSVNGLGSRISTAESTISQHADKIETTVSSVNGLGSRMSTAESTITQHANQIATKVDANGVKSTIQQNPDSIRIGFNRINNYLDLNSDRLLVGHSDGSYTTIGQNGIVYYDAHANWKYHALMKQGWLGAITGTTWSRTITLPPSFKGKVFSVIVSVSMVAAVNTHDVIKHFQVTVPHNTVDYDNGTFVINVSALAYYVPGQSSATAIQTDISWIAIA